MCSFRIFLNSRSNKKGCIERPFKTAWIKNNEYKKHHLSTQPPILITFFV